MELAVRRFAKYVLLLHLTLLVAVLAVVLFASRAIEQGARQQALEQATSRQDQLAAQTARGIESFYKYIQDDMDLLPRSDDTQVERNVFNLDLFTRAAPKTPLGQRGVLLGFVLARQLDERVSHLFVLDKGDMVPHALLREELAEEQRLGRGTTRPATQPAPALARRAAGAAPPRPKLVAPSGPQPTEAEKEIVERNRAWFTHVFSQKQAAVGDFQPQDRTHIIALPLGPRMLVVATVPVEKINEKFLDRLNQGGGDTGAFLVDESMTAMAASRPKLVGSNLQDAADDGFKAVLAQFKANEYQGTLLLRERFRVGGHEFAASMVTAEPIDVLGKRWFLLVASPLSEVDRVVASLFKRIVSWAIFVTLAVTGILVSTAVQMIRGRMKMERLKMQVLKKELDRARQIQQAWLPRAAPSCRELDVAAVNYPAQHISGDFYNWFDLPDGRTAVAIGDVTGHGMSAAFLMATTQLLVRTTMSRITDPGRCLEEVNRQLCTQVFNGQFVTLQLIVLDPETGTIELATAGHPAPLVARCDDTPDGSMAFRRCRSSRSSCWGWKKKRPTTPSAWNCRPARCCCSTPTAPPTPRPPTAAASAWTACTSASPPTPPNAPTNPPWTPPACSSRS